MSRENRAGRDQRPPADRHAQIESALDARTLAALAQAWSMAAERGLIAGKDIVEIVEVGRGLPATDERRNPGMRDRGQRKHREDSEGASCGGKRAVGQ